MKTIDRWFSLICLTTVVATLWTGVFLGIYIIGTFFVALADGGFLWR